MIYNIGDKVTEIGGRRRRYIKGMHLGVITQKFEPFKMQELLIVHHEQTFKEGKRIIISTRRELEILESNICSVCGKMVDKCIERVGFGF